MAQRIKLRCLGGTLAPYSSINSTPPDLLNSNISEDLSFDVSQLQVCRDTTTAEQNAFPAALGLISIKYVKANHFQTSLFYINEGQDDVNAAANA